jgi:hypothetical protein
MKTNIAICLALLTASSPLMAEQKGRGSNTNRAQIQQSAARVAPRQAPAPIKRVMPVPQARVPAARVNVAPTKKPAIARQAPRISATLPGKAVIPSGSIRRNIPQDNRIPGKGAGLHQGRDAANAIREHGSLRNGQLEGLREHGITGGTQGRGPQTPADPFQDSGFTPRQPQAPDGVKQRGDNGGLTDIRGARQNSSRGHVSHGDVFADGYRMRFGAGSGFNGTMGNFGEHSSATPSGEDNGDSYQVDYTNRDGSTGTYSVTETHDQNGRYVTVEHDGTTKHDGTVVSHDTRRDADGRIISTTETVIAPDGSQSSMTTYPDGHADVDVRPATESGADRTPDGIGNGVRTGPSAATVSGLVPLDLLRQHADGQQNSGGPGQYSLQGGRGADQVRPVGEGQQSGVGGVRRVPLDPKGTVVNPGPIDSTPGSGDDRP